MPLAASKYYELLVANSPASVTTDHVYLTAVVLYPGTAATTLVIDDASGGNTIMELKAPANDPSVQVPLPGGVSATGLYLTLTGTASKAYVYYNPK